MKLSIEKQTLLGLGLASAVILGVNLLSYWSFIKHKETSAWVGHTREVLQKLESTLLTLKDAEDGQRGYLITGEERYLQPYIIGSATINQEIQELRKLTADNFNQQQRLNLLEPLVTKRLILGDQTIKIRRENGFTAAQKIVRTDRGKKLMDQISSVLNKMEDEENKLLLQRLKQELVNTNKLNLISSTGVLVNFLFFYLVYSAIRRESLQRQQAQAALQKVNAELEIRVAERTDELRLANENLLRSQIELSQTLEKEKELNQFKSRIITTISHEYRTPLTVILSSTELLQDYSHKWSEDKKMTHLRRIQTTTKHMTNLVSDVLFIGKAELNKLEFKPMPLDLEKFCQDLVEQLQPEHNNQIVITFSYRGDGNKAYLDETMLRQIITNLLSNAIKYSPEGGTIKFNVNYFEGVTQFWIQDEGIGIPEAEQQNVFEFFQRGSNVGTLPGTGLGLSIVKKCVDLQEGQITLKSVVNQGTTFSVMLPATSTCKVNTLAFHTF